MQPFKIALVTTLLAATQIAMADQQTATGTVPLNDLSGLGIAYAATWFTSEGSLSFEPEFNRWGSLVAVGGLFRGMPTSVTSGSFEFQADIQIRFIDLATGTTAFPDLAPPGTELRAFSAALTSFSTRHEPYAIRFSNPSLVTSNSVNGLPPLSTVALFNAPDSVAISFSTRFQAGQYLKPSDDPNCASLSCMVAGRDELVSNGLATFSISYQPVPEPATYLLLAVGGLVTLTTVRRRSASTPRQAT